MSWSSASAGSPCLHAEDPADETFLNTLWKLIEKTETINTLIDTPPDVKVTDADSALEALGSVADQLGCDEHTILVLDSIRPTENGLTYYFLSGSRGYSCHGRHRQNDC